MTYNITYHAATCNMGEVCEVEAAAYREWAFEQLTREYPLYAIEVDARDSLTQCHTDDEENIDAIRDFCAGLWDRCNWEFLDR